MCKHYIAPKLQESKPNLQYLHFFKNQLSVMKPLSTLGESLSSSNLQNSKVKDLKIHDDGDKNESEFHQQAKSMQNGDGIEDVNTKLEQQQQRLTSSVPDLPEKPSSTDFSTHFVIRRHSNSDIKAAAAVTLERGSGLLTTEAEKGVKENQTVHHLVENNDDAVIIPGEGKCGAKCDKFSKDGVSPEEVIDVDGDEEERSFDLRQTAALTKPAVNSCARPVFPPAVRRPVFQHPFMNRKKLSICDLSDLPLLEKPGMASVKLPTSPMDHNYEPISAYCIQEKDNICNLKSNSNNNVEKMKPLERILEACTQRNPIPIELIFKELKNIKKIGEGVYGEVYLGTFRCVREFTWVYKVVAIEGDTLVNGEKQKKFMEILPEIIVSQELNQLRSGVKDCRTTGYVHMQNARIAVGKYPSSLVTCWDKYDEEYESDNDRPNNFLGTQLYMVLEFEFAGKDIESINFRDARQSLSVVLQVAHALAVGEKALEFEHRDLHWGNIMVDNWQNKYVEFVLDGDAIFVPARGIKVLVIDFTMARLKNAKDSVICLDLQDDEEQFLGTGDHQFDIYRMMRDYNRNDWQKYFPKTNIFWLHYLAHKFSSKGHYINNEGETTVKDNTSHSKAVRELVKLSHTIFEYESASHFVHSEECEEYKQFLEFC